MLNEKVPPSAFSIQHTQSLRQHDDLHFCPALRDSEDADRGSQIEPPRPSRAGIDDQPLAFTLDERTMRVAEDQHIRCIAGEQFCWCRAAHFVAVADVNAKAVDFNRDLCREKPIEWIDISINGLHRCNGGECVQHMTSADVARVQDP